MKIILEGERPWSWNKMYAGVHWSERKAEADRVHMLMFSKYLNMRDDQDQLPELTERVDIHITAYFKNKPQDPDNICSKMYIDGLIGTLIADDTREYVRKVTVQSEVDKENPRVEIEVTEA